MPEPLWPPLPTGQEPGTPEIIAHNLAVLAAELHTLNGMVAKLVVQDERRRQRARQETRPGHGV
jgi:hypothetical protein